MSALPTLTPKIVATPSPNAATLQLDDEAFEASNVNWYLSNLESFHFIGLLKNTGETPLASAKVTVTLWGEASQLLAQDSALAEPEVIYPGQTSPFNVTFLDDLTQCRCDASNPEWKSYEVLVEARASPDHGYYADLAILEGAGSPTGARAYQIEGRIQNTGNQDARSVKVVAMAYDAGDRLIGTGVTYLSTSPLPVGATAPFTLFISETAPGSIEHYELVAEARRGD